jgi:hypothetical protein
MNKQVKELLDQEMTRKEFLKKTGLIVLALLGVPAMISVLTPGAHNKGKLPGYGMQDYGP